MGGRVIGAGEPIQFWGKTRHERAGDPGAFPIYERGVQRVPVRDDQAVLRANPGVLALGDHGRPEVYDRHLSLRSLLRVECGVAEVQIRVEMWPAPVRVPLNVRERDAKLSSLGHHASPRNNGLWAERFEVGQ